MFLAGSYLFGGIHSERSQSGSPSAVSSVYILLHNTIPVSQSPGSAWHIITNNYIMSDYNIIIYCFSHFAIQNFPLVVLVMVYYMCE